MGEWDSSAAVRLERVTADLREAGVVDVLAQEVRQTWAVNLQRYEPRELGDTPQLLGLLCAGNIGQRVLRCYADRARAAHPDGSAVVASLPDGSLLVRACGVDLQVRKAPGEALQPDWTGFSWEESVGLRRHAAASANSNAYRPAASDQDGRSQTLDDGGLWPLNDADGLRHVVLVWAGDLDGGLTSGWLGFPSLGSPPWFAVTPLWRDTASQRAGGHLSAAEDPTPVGDTFSERAEPTLSLGLRPRRQERQE